MVGSRLFPEGVAVLDEAGSAGDFFVKGNDGGIAVAGQPVDARCAALTRFAIDRFNQGATDTLVALRFIGEEIREVAVVALRPGGPMAECVHDADDLVIDERHQPEHWLPRVPQTRPGQIGRRGINGHAIEGLVTLPQALPVGVMLCGKRRDGDDFRFPDLSATPGV